MFDSGIGGLTVVKAVKRHLPDYDILYFGDTARTPYGTKSPETVIQYAVEDAEFLLEKGAQMLVVACNTASSTATDTLKERFDVPILEVISPAVNMAVSDPNRTRVGIIGTRATVNSRVYEDKIKAIRPEMKSVWPAVPSAGTPGGGRLAEEGGNQKDCQEVPPPTQSQTDRCSYPGLHALSPPEGYHTGQNWKAGEGY